jgi:uncharacterized membrane protein
VSEKIVGRDPVEKTLVEMTVEAYPGDSDEQVAARIVRAFRNMGDPDAEVPMTAEVVARWRPDVSR